MQIGFLIIAMVLSVFAARLVQLQGVDPRSYAQMAAAEGTQDVVLPATRGEIVDRKGRPLAGSVDGRMIVADPKVTSKVAPELATILSDRLGIDYFEALKRLRAEASRFEYIARQVPASKAEKVVDEIREKFKDEKGRPFAGLMTERDPLRVYPSRTVAANLVGFLGTPTNKGAAQPLAGLETSFNRYLSGKDGEARYTVGAGNQIPLGDNTITPAVDGKSLQLTIDSDLQYYAQRVLQKTVVGAGGKSGIAVVVDTRTGEVLALADYPTYDAADPYDYDKDLYKSSALTDVYEPGSVEKVLTMSALIDAGLAYKDQKFKVPGKLYRQDRPIGDYWDHGMLKLTLAGILAKSSNIGTVLAADQFKRGQLRQYLERFGLGARTGVGLGGETKGILPNGSDWTSQVGDRIAFGQSLSVNALQMAAAVNTIANGGVRIDPSLVKGSATTDGGVAVGTDNATSRRVISEKAAHETMLMMERVVDPDAGVAPRAAIPGYRVAGKTGTAQRVGDNGGYDGSTTVSFAGFAPADKPRFTVYVVVHSPRAGSGGGSTAGPAFAELMSYTLRRYGVAPTGAKPNQTPVEW
ncbi:penicillin-binding protein 2 [Pimelobacter simplex]|uniref:Cell division protein FtsI [Peptidoglycan synthetase] n=2 Tax=Nocardioides simplex TaxID=2045 RepID=A0A0A1DKM7_NOCSI|nr:Cell division protein FtsI [Peptidoglycan synthetase] [Pimelobacter simplex]KAB2807637.1 penicillin-binding protein 2 [Pimelobacter simplex]MCG8151616.1 penicillin-binding protein 2 [Pimelobacter simplex]GEB13203.1 cell division protein [Pimelobacter simplex]SFM48132.1 peptidoglycan synthetase FtsI [Pimelobacter simplex]